MFISTQPAITKEYGFQKLENASKSMENYNESSSMQLKWIHLGKNNLELTVPLLQLNDETFTIVDFACSHGKNSMNVINQLLDGVNDTKDVKNIRSMMVYHNDLPDNDFDEVMNCVNDAKLGYKTHELITLNDIELETRTVGISYYNQIVEDETVDFAFCYTSLHWMPEYKPLDFGLMYIPQTDSPEFNTFFDQISGKYLKQWLKLRFLELKFGGIVSFNIISWSNFNDIMNFEWNKFLKSKGIGARELADVYIPVVCRPRYQILNAIQSFKAKYKVLNFESIKDSAKLCKFTFKAMLYNQLIAGLSKHRDLFETKERIEKFYEEFEAQCYEGKEFINFETVTEWILLQKI